ncbi:hypothetical protein [Tuberibacillus sp. Marseille-P3662]|uniref:hypothetical protein n=1 Tax=Tuberibacillus sp. Marseille-P3662 TaxID=1965358 RepID=UPI000A1CAD2E|nr:hypothetical protein [Tuberibacillus sp. Marseille-P3662]
MDIKSINKELRLLLYELLNSQRITCLKQFEEELKNEGYKETEIRATFNSLKSNNIILTHPTFEYAGKFRDFTVNNLYKLIEK